MKTKQLRDKSGKFLPAEECNNAPNHSTPADHAESSTQPIDNAHATSPTRSAPDHSPSRSSYHSDQSRLPSPDRPQSPYISLPLFAATLGNLVNPNRTPGNRAPIPPGTARAASNSHHRAQNNPTFHLPPVSAMSHKQPTGLTAMPTGRSRQAPHFEGNSDEILSEFLHEYEDLADGNGLSEKLKVETVLRYVPRSLRNLWMNLPGYRAASWHHFQAQLEDLYPDIAASTRCTRQGLTEFIELSARCHVRDEGDVLSYYRNFLTIAIPLLEDRKLTDDDFNAEFFKGFHLDDQDTLTDQVFNINPRHPVNRPFDVQDVLSAARQYFASDRFHKPLQRRVRNDLCGRSKTCWGDPEKLIQWLFGDKRTPKPTKHEDDSDSEQEEDDAPTPERSTYETRSVRFKDPSSARSQTNEDDSLTLVTKLKALSVHEPSYLVLYSQCQERFPTIAQHLPKPELFPTQAPPISATVTYQSPPAPPRQSWAQRTPTPSASSSVTTVADKDGFFSDRNGARTRGCAFCGMLGHRVRGCPAAEEYVDTGRVKIFDNRLFLPTGQPIPNDGRGLGLQASVDAWLSANKPPSSDSTTPTPQRDAPPHATSCSFEIVPEPAVPTGAYITEEADSDAGSDDHEYTMELYDMYEVFATKKKDLKPSKASTAPPPTLSPSPPPASAAPPAPSTSTGRVPQYRYQASAKDQALTKELLGWILEGKLERVTPAHIFAASPPVCKELVERLKLHRIKTASFEQVDDDAADPVSVLGLATKREAEFSLPLREIDILVNNHSTEAGVLDQGSQIVVIREDLANEVGAKINRQRTLHMEGANGSTSRTLGCAEDLDMRIGDVSFTIHAHVVRTAPFRLLPGRPFHNLLLCRLEDHPDHVDVSIRNPADPSHFVAVPSRARQAAQAGFVAAFACQIRPDPPCMEALERYVASPHFPLPPDPLPTPDVPITVLAYKKAARKVHPVAASLPEDFCIIRRRPEDPLLSLPALPTHPPEFTPGTRLTQEHFEALNLNKFDFLWPEEAKLAAHILKVNEKALAWSEAERGRFRDDYFSPVKIPTVVHTPWVHKNILILTGLLDKVIEMFKEKIAAGVYEPSDASYRSCWFCIPKKNGSLQLVHDLQPLNAVTIRNAAVPPFVDQFVEGIAGRSW